MICVTMCAHECRLCAFVTCMTLCVGHALIILIRHLFEVAVQTYLKGKTVVIATNQLQFLAEADKVVVVKDGKQREGHSIE